MSSSGSKSPGPVTVRKTAAAAARDGEVGWGRCSAVANSTGGGRRDQWWRRGSATVAMVGAPALMGRARVRELSARDKARERE